MSRDQAGEWADQLIRDMMSGYLPLYRSVNKYVTFAGVNERNDHRGYVDYLKSPEFQTVLADLGDSAAVDGIEALTL